MPFYKSRSEAHRRASARYRPVSQPLPSFVRPSLAVAAPCGRGVWCARPFWILRFECGCLCELPP